MSATICWSLMVVCAGLSLGWRGRRRMRLYVVSTTIICLIGFSRLYLGVHYPSVMCSAGSSSARRGWSVPGTAGFRGSAGTRNDAGAGGGRDKNDCADLGLIKVDLLGLGIMAVLKDR